jgi:hypothetical protein
MNAPKRGKKYWEVVNRGCGGYRDYWGEYDCKHPYDWTCDDCPCCIEHQKEINNPLASNCSMMIGLSWQIAETSGDVAAAERVTTRGRGILINKD